MKSNRRIHILVGIAVILAVWRVVDRFSGGSTMPQTAWSESSSRPRTGNQSLDKKIEILAGQPPLEFEREKTPLPEIDPEARNPFIYGVDQTRELARKREMERMRELVALEAETEEQVIESPQPDEPEFKGTILGLFRDPALGQRIAVKVDEELFIVKEGDLVGHGFRVQSINQESVVLQHVDSSIDVEIPFDRDASTTSHTW